MLSNSNLKPLKQIRVLYVEDDLETREELQILLSDLVGELYVAINGHEGLTLYEEHRPDIVITDIQMPDMNGLSMAADIRHIFPEQAIVILSAYNDTEYLFRALELGIQHYITKPISIERLIEQLLAITGQLHMVRELRQQRKFLDQYKLLMDETAIVGRINQQGTITYVNQRFCHISGFSADEVIGQNYQSLCEKESQRALIELTQQLIKTGTWNGILVNKTKSGGRYIVDATIMVIRNSAGELDEYVALMLDVTEIYERHQRLALNLEQDLKQQKQLLNEYERALEIGTSLCIVDPEGIIMSANLNFCESLKSLADELRGQSFFGMVKENSNFKEWAIKQIKAEGHLSKVLKFNVNEHEEITLSVVLVAIYDVEGEIHSYLAMSQDITDSVRLNEEIVDTQKEFIYLMGDIVENRSQETGKHLKRVAILSKFLAEKNGMSDEFSEMIKIAAPMHDIGKVGITDDVLHKAGKLTETEFGEMKKHCNLGFNLLKDINKPLMKMAATIAHEHHEHFDGSGYPLGLDGNNISLEARIVSLIDVFDALSSKRVYKEAWAEEDILSYIKEQKGKHFDPQLIDLFVENYTEILAIRNRFQD